MKVQDIRSFFHKPKEGEGNQRGSPVLSSPEVVEVPTRRRKGPSKKDEKRKNSQDQDGEDPRAGNASESDEDPLPKSSRAKKSSGTKEKSKKAKALPPSDESDGEDPIPKKIREKVSKASTERKRKAKVLSDSEEEDFDLKKTSNGKQKATTKEKAPEKKGKKIEEKKDQKPKVNVDPADFFSSGPIKRQKTEKKEVPVPVEKPEVKIDKNDKSPKKESSPEVKRRSSSRSPKKKIPDSTSQESLKEQTPTRRESQRDKGTPPSRRTLDFESSPSSRSPKKPHKDVKNEKNPPLEKEKKPKVEVGSPIKEKRSPRKEAVSSPKKEKMSPKKDVFKTPTPQRKESSRGTGTKRRPKRSKSVDDEDNFEPKMKQTKAPPAKKQAKTPVKNDDDELQPIKTPEEKKKAQQQNYSKFMSKVNAKPKNLGLKDIPEGAPDCLKNQTFVITGVLDSLERDSCKDLVEQYGGRVTQSVSKKTTYLIVGDDPGESKTRKAAQLSIPHLTEDGLLEIIRQSNPNGEFSSATLMDFDEIEQNKEEKEEYDPDKSLFESDTKSKKDGKTSPKKDRKASPRKSEKPREIKEEKPSTSTKPSNDFTSTKKDPRPEDLMYVDKYKPKSLKQVVGQAKDSSNASKLVRWLKNWFNYHGNSQDKKAKPGWPGMKDPEGKTFKCALLSGPPGIGKTTTAHLACKELGYDFFELNASDTRNKSGLKANVAGAITSNIIVLGDKSEDGFSRKHALIMDEVDGMSGNEDRGGVQELITLIKSSRIPIICICNDRNHQKIRSLSNYCYDLRFNKPTIQELKGFVSSICFKEKIKADQQKLTQLMISTDQDIRQILNQLQMFKDGNSDQVLNPKKDLKFGPWDVCRKVFSKQEHGSMNIHEKTGLFFQDYSFGPLFVQENYLKQKPAAANGCKYKTLNLIHKSAAAIADGDLVDNLIRRTMNWGMLPVQAIFSSHMPGEYMESNNIGPIEFPQWLGKNSNKNKRHRLLQSLHTHVHLEVSGSLEALNMDYLPYLRRSIVNPLANADHEKAAEKMEAYALLRDDLESINDLALWPGMRNPMDKVESKVKAAFTRLVNKEILPYSNATSVKAKGRAKTDEFEGLEDEDDGAPEEEEEETVEKDNMVKMKTKKSSTTTSKSRGSKYSESVEEKPSSSKANAKGSRAKK